MQMNPQAYFSLCWEKHSHIRKNIISGGEGGASITGVHPPVEKAIKFAVDYLRSLGKLTRGSKSL